MKNLKKLLLICFPVLMTAQTQTENYIKTVTYKTASTTKITAPTISQAAQNITYFDGLGRPKQKVSYQQSASGKDLVTLIEYDGLGRQTKEYLPYASSQTNGSYIDPTTLLTNVTAQYQAKYGTVNANPFSEKKIESSPLNRVLQQGAPGSDWTLASGHTVKFDYNANAANEVKKYYVTTTWTAGSGLYEIALGNGAGTTFYGAGQLYKNIIYDENTAANPTEAAGSTVEFKNKEGQVVLKRTYDAGVKHDTYYVYDIHGNLTYVIPPKADAAIDANILNGFCYQYKYDSRNRLVEKKLPGRQWEFIVYDKLDRPVATGPAASPFKDDTAVGWVITKYDAFSRPIYTGWSSQSVSSAARNTLQNTQNSATSLFEAKQTSGTIDGIAAYYSNANSPTSFKLLTVNYYDNYAFPGAQPIPSAVEGQTVLANIKGLASGTWRRALSAAASAAGETATVFYDAKGRPIRNYTQNHLGGYTYTDSKLDFSGKVLYTIGRHKRTSGNAELTVKEDFTYSPQDQLLTHTHQINGGATQLIAANTYDELGQLISKNVGNTTGSPLQKVGFDYNIRGWLTEINKTSNLQQGSDPKDLFAFKISYTTPLAGITGVKGLYNGNISETLWKTAADNADRGYGYKYDNLNRLTNAIYEKNGLTTNAYDESLTYDKNGNIMSLARKGDTDPQIQPIEIDNLIYTYQANSNRLGKVDDSSNNTSGFNDFNKTGDDYSYDANGNLITDKNKKITDISYNHLNLPKKITFGTTGSIEYIYNAAGEKLEKIVTEGTTVNTTNYLDGFQYKNAVLEFFPTAEGYVKNTGGVYSYVFQYKDHLGNVRVSYAKNPTTQVLEIIEENNYYPFGLKHKGYNDYLPTANKYKFNNKELQDELGLAVYDYGARFYDPATGRWYTMDAMAEKYSEMSPYNYALNNPVIFVDPDGNEVEMCCDGLKAFVLTAVDDSFGTDYRNQYDTGSTAYHNGVMSAHASTMAVGAFMMADGAISATAGTTGLLGSGAVAATGIGAPVGAIGATGSAILVGKGVVEGVLGGVLTGNSASNMIKDSQTHGNSKSSTKEQHGYEIKNDTKNTRHKVGVSGEKLNANGTSRRANSQVNKLNKKGGDKFSAEVKVKGVENRTEILNWEQTEVNSFYQQTQTTPAGQTRPKPKPNGGT